MAQRQGQTSLNFHHPSTPCSWQYIEYPNGQFELYDLSKNPHETDNIFYEAPRVSTWSPRPRQHGEDRVGG